MTWRVLIAEDEFLIALDLESAFQGAGAQVVGPVRRVDDALALPLDRFDAAVLDLELEDGFCYPFALKLLEAGIPFVLATGHGRDQLTRGLASVPCLAKPISGQTLLETLTARVAMLGRPAVLGTASCDERQLLRVNRAGFAGGSKP